MMVTPGIIELQRAEDGFLRARIAGPTALIPAPGAFSLAHNPAFPDEPLAVPLFACGYTQSPDGFVAAPTLPSTWRPGDVLQLSGPFGQGFQPLHGKTRLALVGLSEHIARLLPLASAALEAGAAVALFTNAPLPRLSTNIEAASLADLPDSISWADHIVIDSSLSALESLPPDLLAALPSSTEVLVATPLPCAGLADCGLCAVPAKRGKWLHACTDGPVFSLGQLGL